MVFGYLFFSSFFFFNPTGRSIPLEHKEYVQGDGLKAKKSLLLLLGLIHVSFHLFWMNLIEVFWQRELECWFQLCVLPFLFPLNSPFTSCSLGSYPLVLFPLLSINFVPAYMCVSPPTPKIKSLPYVGFKNEI